MENPGFVIFHLPFFIFYFPLRLVFRSLQVAGRNKNE